MDWWLEDQMPELSDFVSSWLNRIAGFTRRRGDAEQSWFDPRAQGIFHHRVTETPSRSKLSVLGFNPQAFLTTKARSSQSNRRVRLGHSTLIPQLSTDPPHKAHEAGVGSPSPCNRCSRWLKWIGGSGSNARASCLRALVAKPGLDLPSIRGGDGVAWRPGGSPMSETRPTSFT